VRFLIDAQLPPVLARELTVIGHPSQAVRDLGLREADDELIWNHAAAQQLVIMTKDEDFARRVCQTPEGPSVVWLRIGNCSNRALLDHLVPLLTDIVERIHLGDRIVEVS
jgi:predicted nuclease of predicted toxin-antitoxin system